jgi:hypothetical protein
MKGISLLKHRKQQLCFKKKKKSTRARDPHSFSCFFFTFYQLKQSILAKAKWSKQELKQQISL